MKHCVIGSINMDLVMTVDRFPLPGETVTGREFSTVPGGKGANQAVALARFGSAVRMVGNVGDDAFGEKYLDRFAAEKVDTSGIERVAGTATGIAVIEVEVSGENRIVVISGANGKLTPSSLDGRAETKGKEIVLLQLEIPLETVEWVLVNRSPRCIYILDPAPARPLPASVYSNIDWLTPNETELGLLAGMEVRTESDILKAACALRSRGIKRIVVKAGERGAYLVSDEGLKHIPGFKVSPVDTTGAGDTFNAGLAHALGKDFSPWEAIRFACAAAALSTTKFGAQGAMPDEETVLAFLKRN